MGMIRVSDEVEGRLKAVADGRSMNSVIEKMLAYCSSPDGFCSAPQADVSYEPYLLEQINKRFDELKALIEDTTVDRLSNRLSGRNSSASHQDPIVKQALLRTDIDWYIVQELVFEFLDEKAPEWFPGMAKAVHNMDDDVNCFTKDEVLYFENSITGSVWPVLHVSPRVDKFLAEKIEGGINVA